MKFHTLGFLSLFIAFTLQTSFAQIPTDGLVGYFMLDGNAADSSGLANDGVIVDQVSPTENRFGEASKACLFEGGYIDAGNPLDFQLTEAITIAAWVKPTLIDDWSGIVAKWAGVDGGYYLGLNPDNNALRWNILGPESLDGSSLLIDEWIHIAATYDGDSIFIYENSILISTVANSTRIGNNTRNLLIGSQSNLPDRIFNGAIDDVLIYDRGLSQEEVESIFNAEVSSTQNTFLDRSVVLSPNPTNSILKIKNNSAHQILSYTLYNAAGMRLKTAAFQEELDIRDQSSGVYYLILNFEDGSMTKKVVKL